MFVPACVTAKAKYNISAVVQRKHSAPPSPTHSSIFLSVSYNCQASMPKMSTVQIFQLLTLNGTRPSAVHTSEWQLTDQVVGCHRDRSFACYLQLTAQ